LLRRIGARYHVSTRRGASLVEYGIVLALIGAASLPLVLKAGETIASTFEGASDALSAAIDSATYEDEPLIIEFSGTSAVIYPETGGLIEHHKFARNPRTSVRG